MEQLNKADIVVGIQWGDEGKGRIVDLFAADYDVVARFGGGDNAGHSIIVGDTKLALRIVPSGVMQPHTQLFIGGGCVVSLEGLLAELDGLSAKGIDVSRIRVSDRAHVVMPYHAAIDRASEAARGAAAIGTTGRGIGPAYVDKVARNGITFADLGDEAVLAERIRANVARAAAAGVDVPDAGETIAATLARARRVLPRVVDGVAYIHEAMEAGKKILIEGAQGTLLDVGFGTYPYVTSSHTVAGGACIGLGIGPSAIGTVTGVVKAYCTRVGAGPFPSELLDETGERLRAKGAEFGVVTGRPRRCGWFDAVAGRYAVRINGLSAVAITKLDVLSGFERIGIVTGYGDGGVEVEEHDGWSEPIGDVRRIADLPAAARAYVARIEALLGVPATLVSVGPERAQLAR